LFRIDRNLVNLSVRRPVQVETRVNEADADGEARDAAASAASAAYEAEQIVAEALETAEARANEILSQAEAEAKKKASRIVDDAKNEAAALVVAAREQVELDRRAAWQEGFSEGSEEGRRSYDEQLADKKREDDEQLKHVIEELYSERTNTYDRLEDDVVELAIRIVRKVISPAEDEFGGYFESLIVSALRQINPEGKIVIKVSPSEYERFFSSGNAVFELDSGVTVTASIQKDMTLTDGDCIIDTEDATVNAGLDTQLKNIELAFSQIES